jgi:tRNA(Ile)-lysidine synthase
MSKRLPPFSADQLLQTLKSMPQVSSYLVAFSGGADSSALLHALATLKNEPQNNQFEASIRAVHINHGLHPHANEWQQHCENMGRSWCVPVSSMSVELKGNGKGMEAEARELRYAALQTMLQPGECLLTAHHADDQAETLLLNLLRGSGVDGLSAMPPQKPFGQHLLLRPLLNVSGKALRDYLERHAIQWLQDPSNLKLDQDRNFVRHEVLPLLESRFEGTTQRLLLTQQSMSESRSLLENLADQYLQDELQHPKLLNANTCLLDSAALFKLVIRRWLALENAPALPGRPLHDLYIQMTAVGSDHRIGVEWADCKIRVYQNQLFLHRGPEIEACKPQKWAATQNNLELGGGLGRLTFDPDLCPDGEIKVINRQVQPQSSLARAKLHHSLKNLLQAAQIPAWLRNCIPLTMIDDELVAVGDWAFSSKFASWLDQNHVKFTWQPDASILQYIAEQQHKTGTTKTD